MLSGILAFAGGALLTVAGLGWYLDAQSWGWILALALLAITAAVRLEESRHA